MSTEIEDSVDQPMVLPVAVVMERQPVEGNRWVTHRWLATGVVTGDREPPAQAGGILVHEDDSGARYLWAGFKLELFKDEAASYYANLMAEQPSVFVICQQEDDGDPEPFFATCCQALAANYLEGDNEVFSVPMAPDIYLWLERYVVQNYVPEPIKKRKRRNWKNEAQRK